MLDSELHYIYFFELLIRSKVFDSQNDLTLSIEITLCFLKTVSVGWHYKKEKEGSYLTSGHIPKRIQTLWQEQCSPTQMFT